MAAAADYKLIPEAGRIFCAMFQKSFQLTTEVGLIMNVGTPVVHGTNQFSNRLARKTGHKRCVEVRGKLHSCCLQYGTIYNNPQHLDPCRQGHKARELTGARKTYVTHKHKNEELSCPR